MLKRPAAALLIFSIGLVASVSGLTLLGAQTLKPPPHVAPSVHLLCTDGNLVNVTSPSPLLDTINGTAVYGCSFGSGQTSVTGAIQVVRAGSVTATFALPVGVLVYLVPNSGSLTALSQAQCISQGILLSSTQAFNLAAGTYSYCESFQDPVVLAPVTVSWFQA